MVHLNEGDERFFFKKSQNRHSSFKDKQKDRSNEIYTLPFDVISFWRYITQDCINNVEQPGLPCTSHYYPIDSSYGNCATKANQEISAEVTDTKHFPFKEEEQMAH